MELARGIKALMALGHDLETATALAKSELDKKIASNQPRPGYYYVSTLVPHQIIKQQYHFFSFDYTFKTIKDSKAIKCNRN
jgi:hypothetical protein